MPRTLTLGLVIALMAPLPAFAQGTSDDLTAGPAVLQNAQRNVNAAEATYGSVGNEGMSGGLTAAVEGTAGGTVEKALADRANARTNLRDAIAQEMRALQEREAHFEKSGDKYDAAGCLAAMDILNKRLDALNTDEANDKLTKETGAPLKPVSGPNSNNPVKSSGGGVIGGGGGGAGGDDGSGDAATAGANGTSDDGAAGGVSKTGADGKFSDSFEKALERAKKEKKLVLADFTGSDWCPWCQKLKKEVFETPEFQTWATKNVILVEIDFPHQKPQSDAVKAANQKLAEKYSVEGYPTVLMLDADGKKIAKLGYQPGGPKPWIAEAQRVIDLRNPVSKDKLSAKALGEDDELGISGDASSSKKSSTAPPAPPKPAKGPKAGEISDDDD